MEALEANNFRFLNSQIQNGDREFTLLGTTGNYQIMHDGLCGDSVQISIPEDKLQVIMSRCIDFGVQRKR